MGGQVHKKPVDDGERAQRAGCRWSSRVGRACGAGLCLAERWARARLRSVSHALGEMPYVMPMDAGPMRGLGSEVTRDAGDNGPR